MLYKNLDDRDLQHVMFIRWFLDYLAAFEMLILKRNLGDFKAIFKARRAFKVWRKDFDETASEYSRVGLKVLSRKCMKARYCGSTMPRGKKSSQN